MINQKFLKLPLLMVVRMTAMRMMVMNVMMINAISKEDIDDDQG